VVAVAIVSIGGGVGALDIWIRTALLICTATELRSLESGSGLHIFLVGTGIYAVGRPYTVLKKGCGDQGGDEYEHGGRRAPL
jgi:hypothetical protein